MRGDAVVGLDERANPRPRPLHHGDPASAERSGQRPDCHRQARHHRACGRLSGRAAMVRRRVRNLYVGLSGQAGASATVRALTGRINPSGHLAETRGRSVTSTARPPAGTRPLAVTPSTARARSSATATTKPPTCRSASRSATASSYDLHLQQPDRRRNRRPVHRDQRFRRARRHRRPAVCDRPVRRCATPCPRAQRLCQGSARRTRIQNRAHRIRPLHLPPFRHGSQRMAYRIRRVDRQPSAPMPKTCR